MLTFSTIKFMPSMLSPVLIGRDAELRALVVALDAAATGAGSALFLTGDPGVGKSGWPPSCHRLPRSVASPPIAGAPSSQRLPRPSGRSLRR